jgi:predicted phosphoribosyltransferase
MFRNREEAAHQLAERLKGRKLKRPLVLAIPRGGVPVGAVVARELNAELDVVLARKLRAPLQPEFAIGAISETGEVYLNPDVEGMLDVCGDYLEGEKRHQMAEIARRKEMFRRVRPRAEVSGRSVIITDDGIATGSTMIAALQLLRAQKPQELIVAVPVAPLERLDRIQTLCDDLICVLRPVRFYAIGQFYEDFSPVEDERVVEILRSQKMRVEAPV